MEGTIPESALPGALAVLGQLKAWSVASDYRDWYNQLADEPLNPPDRPDAEPPAAPTAETPTAATVAAHEPPRRVAALTPGA